MDLLPLEIVGLIAQTSRLVYHPLVLAYPRFTRSLTLGGRLDYAEAFGYDCRVFCEDGVSDIIWGLNGRPHRTDGPAIVYATGTKKWHINGQLHKTDGPAVEHACGSKHWYLYGQLHRTDGPAVENADGSKYWYLYGQLHRADGPAIEMDDGSTWWYLNGLRHRTDGPAVEKADGTKLWYLNGQQVQPGDLLTADNTYVA